jgi:nicotinamidase-related amidase
VTDEIAGIARSDCMTPHFAAILGDQLATMYINEGKEDGPGRRLWPALGASDPTSGRPSRGASAFFPGSRDLQERLQPLGLDMLLIASAVTNICCESSARDATELH